MNLINSFLKKGILVSSEVTKNPQLLEKLGDIQDNELKGVFVIDRAFLEKTFPKKEDDKSNKQETSDNNKEIVIKDVNKDNSSKIQILSSYNKLPGKICFNDFVAHFNRRFETLSSYLRQRQEFQNVTSINRLKNKNDRGSVTLMGLVYEKTITKNKHVMLTLEDPTGTIKVLVSNTKKEMCDFAKDIVLDELIGIEGVSGGELIFANQIFIPDVPILKELKKSPKEEHLVVLGDPHFGSKAFLKKEFENFIAWMNQKKGSPEQKEIASKIKYMVLVGDLVEGVGVYPNQERDLAIKDIEEQYNIFADYLKQIPSHIKIIVCPGNHDVGRIAEPQLPIIHKFAQKLQELPNVVLVSNPAMINIGATNDFPGFDVLIYHGYSFIYYANNIESIRVQGGQKKPELIMKFLLQRRHLAPSHTSNMYIPDTEADPMVITQIPDFFLTGHIHRVSVNNYKNITLINASCWTSITENQEKRGLEPQPAKIPVVNLKTREVKIINFYKEGDE